jgi:hypothetical protein
MEGMRREDVIQYLIDKNKFRSYLEIGVAQCNTFNQIRCEHKVGVDPAVETQTVVGGWISNSTSDAFFEDVNEDKFDVVYIDGLHLYEQVIKDIVNSLNCMNTGGYIVIHDCKPWNNTWERKPASSGAAWNGDVFRSIIWFREIHPEYPCFVLDCDWGLGIIHNDKQRGQMDHWATVEKYKKYDFGWLDTHWQEYGLVAPEYIYKYVGDYNEQIH